MGVEYFGDTRTVDVHVRYLRQKIEDNRIHRSCYKQCVGLGINLLVNKGGRL